MMHRTNNKFKIIESLTEHFYNVYKLFVFGIDFDKDVAYYVFFFFKGVTGAPNRARKSKFRL